MPKGNEDLKAKIAKIQQKGKAQQAPVPTIQEDMPEVEETEEASMEALEAEFEAKKKALMQKTKASPAGDPSRRVPMEDAEGETEGAGLEQAIAEYADDAKFRVEIVFQLVQLNKSMKEIADALKGLVQNDGD